MRRPEEPLIRSAVGADLTAVLQLWDAAGAEPSHTDNIVSLSRLIARDPSALILAADGLRLVGSVVAAWDGWRGSIYRLVVAPDLRRQGLGHLLLGEAEKKLQRDGVVRSQAVVVESDLVATAFWQATDWKLQTERLRYTKG